MKPIFHPRDFQFSEMPDKWQEIDFETAYCKWLVEYLLKIDKPVPVFQQLTWELLDIADPIASARKLGELALQHNLYYVEPYDDGGQLPESYELAFEVMQEEHLESMKGLEGDLYEPLESWINPEIWAHLEREFKEYGQVASKAPDVGYRVILAKLAKQTKAKVRQLELIKAFYKGFLGEGPVTNK